MEKICREPVTEPMVRMLMRKSFREKISKNAGVRRITMQKYLRIAVDTLEGTVV